MLQLVVAAKEQAYIRRLADYVRGAPQGADWRITGFSGADALRQYLQGGYPADLLLLQPWALAEAERCAPNVPKAALVRRPGEAGMDGIAEIRQYQSMPELLRSLSALRAVRGGRPVPLGGAEAGRTAVLAVYSPAGGIGKTTAALHLAQQAGLRGMNAFYWNLEPFDAAGWLLDGGEGDSAARMLYALKAKPDSAADEFRRLRRFHPVLKADYFPGAAAPEERFALQADDASQLLDVIVSSGDYDLVIVDLDVALGELHMAMFERSAAIIWLVAADPAAERKTEVALRFARRSWPDRFGQAERLIRYVDARVDEDAGRTRPEGRRRTVAGLPYVPQRRTAARPGEWLAPPAYRAAVARLLDKLGMIGGSTNAGRAHRADAARADEGTA